MAKEHTEKKSAYFNQYRFPDNADNFIKRCEENAVKVYPDYKRWFTMTNLEEKLRKYWTDDVRNIWAEFLIREISFSIWNDANRASGEKVADQLFTTFLGKYK